MLFYYACRMKAQNYGIILRQPTIYVYFFPCTCNFYNMTRKIKPRRPICNIPFIESTDGTILNQNRSESYGK